jgi:peptide/nickel transport system substrate-binding protein
MQDDHPKHGAKAGRRRLGRALFAAAATLVGTGAFAFSSGGVALAASGPVKGGTYTYDMEIAPQCADPQVSPQFATYQLSRPVLDSLVASSNGKVYKPWLATSWTISPNAEHYTFTLRQGVTFSDGTPFNAAAVKVNFDRIFNPATKSEYARTLLGPYAGTTVLSPYKVEVNFTEGFNSFLYAASTANLGIQSPTALAKNPPCSPPVGSGPYIITSYNEQTGATLVNRPSYAWDPGTAKNKGAAYISKMVFNFVPDDTTREGSLTSGQVDNIEAPPATDVASLKSQGFQIIDHPQPGGVYDLYISEKTAPWNNTKARLALRDALNVPGIIEALYDGVYQPAWSPIAATTPGFNSAVVNSWHQNVKESEKLLAQLGYTKRDAAGYLVNSSGQELDGVLQGGDTREQREQLSLLIQQEEAKVGIKLTLDNSAADQENIFTGDFAVTASAHVEASPDILRLLFDSADFPGAGGLNYGQASFPQLDSWLNEATGSLNTALQDKLYGEAQKFIVDNAVSVPLYQEETLNAATPKLKGITYDATGYVLYYDAWLAK